ncbi:MAG: glutaredoxin [Myxococcaceae bacterium]|nr:glutaredoxin [Myxococcaceae bacterium]
MNATTSENMGTGSARNTLDPRRVAPEAAQRAAAFHADVVQAVERAVQTEPVVVVGMAQNPFVKKTRRALADAGIAFTYLEYGSYLSKWKQRLAIKIWSGWATFPQVFVRGVLIGGHALTVKGLADGSLQRMLSTKEGGAPEVQA